jgi:DNA-binding beta-propeller fold protein YncE
MRRSPHLVRVLVFSCVVILGAVVFSHQVLSKASTSTRAPRFCAISGIAVTGTHVWVSGCTFSTRSAFSHRNPSVVELNAGNGSLVRIIKDRDAGNDGPAGIAASGSRVWVANGDGNSVLELNARNGSVVRLIKAKLDRLSSPWDVAASGSSVWVMNAESFSITELNARNWSLVRVIHAKADEIPGVGTITANGTHVWLTNGSYSGNSVIELNANDGSLVRLINAKDDGFNEPAGLAVRGTHLWVTSDDGPKAVVPLADAAPNWPGGSVTELNRGDGSVVRVITAKPDQFLGSQGIAVGRSRVWVTNGFEDSLTELNANSGSLVRVINAKADGLSGTQEVALIGGRLWAVNAAVQIGGSCCDVWGSTITVLNSNDGSLVRIIN